MATRKPSPRFRALRPAAEDLESRQLLAATVSGFDAAGDAWTLRLVGPGSLVVTKQNDASGNPTALTDKSDIKQITIGGTDPRSSRLVGTVVKAAGSDGRVFFENLTELSSRSERFPGGNGPLAINIPDFWLGNTVVATATPPTTPTTPAIAIPDGTNTLHFGGVDTTHNRTNPPATGTTSDVYSTTLGLPIYGGTRIIIDKSISSSQSMTASGSTTPTTIQHAVTFDVSGRLDLFQANAIEGDAKTPPGQFLTNNSAATGFGGTFVFSGTAGEAPFLSTVPTLQGAVTGQIGNLRVGGNATNLTALVRDGTNAGNDKITNFSIGGETDNVLVVAPGGLKNAAFGLGMDKTEIRTHVLNTLSANRGALDAKVVSDRTISKVTLGGDVVNSTFESGTLQNFSLILATIAGQLPATSVFSSAPPPGPAPDALNAQTGGGMIVQVAGDVTNSVFAASVQPEVTPPASTAPVGTLSTRTFGSPQQLTLPTGHITAKVEGKIDNSSATPDMPTKAFYASDVNLTNGPVIPPNNPSAPYTAPQKPVTEPGILNLNAKSHLSASPTFNFGTSIPRGPRNNTLYLGTHAPK